MHYNEGMLQSYLDNQLSYEEKLGVEDHLKECVSCRDTLDLLAEEDQKISSQIKAYSKAAASFEVNMAGKWQDFMTLVQHENQDQGFLDPPAPKSAEENREKRSWKIMNKKWQRWVAGVAAVAVICGVFTLPTVQMAAAQLLKVFRVEQIETVKMTPEDVREIVEKIQSEVGTVDLRSFGKLEVLKTSEYESINMGAAKEKGFIEPGYLPEGVSVSDVELHSGEKVEFSLDVDKVNQLIKQLGGNTPLPEGIRGKAFTLETFDAISGKYQLADGRSLKISQTKSPRLEVDGDIDSQQLMKSLWDFPFLPENIKDQLKQVSSLENTVVLPEVEGETERININGITVLRTVYNQRSEVTMEITEDGNEEMIVNGEQVRVRRDFEAGNGSANSYLWVKDGRLFVVESSGLNQAEVEKIVESLL